MKLRIKLFFICLSLYFFVLSKSYRIFKGLTDGQIALALVLGAIVMFGITYWFLHEPIDKRVDPDLYLWFNYARPLDPYHYPRQQGWYFWAFDFIAFYGPYESKDEAKRCFLRYARTVPKDEQTKYNQQRRQSLGFDK